MSEQELWDERLKLAIQMVKDVGWSDLPTASWGESWETADDDEGDGDAEW